jgi:hypothetical protein
LKFRGRGGVLGLDDAELDPQGILRFELFLLTFLKVIDLLAQVLEFSLEPFSCRYMESRSSAWSSESLQTMVAFRGCGDLN